MDIAIIKTMCFLVLYVIVVFTVLYGIYYIVRKAHRIERIEQAKNELQNKSCDMWIKKYKNSLTPKSIERLFELEGKDMFVT